MTTQAIPIGRIPRQTYHRWRSCTGKVKHRTWSDATATMHRMRHKHDEHLTPYRCGYCNQIHLGHSRRKQP